MDSVFAVYPTEERIMKINREKIPGGIPEDFRPDSDLLKIESLQELTGGQESGILIYDENVLVCNWAGQEGPSSRHVFLRCGSYGWQPRRTDRSDAAG